MKTFDSIKNFFAILGFDSSQSTRKDLLKIETVLPIIFIGIDIILTIVSVHYEASNFEEYVNSIYLLSSLILSFFIFTTLLWQMPTHYKFITTLENTLKKRLLHPVSKIIYIKIDEKLQIWHELLDIALVKTMPAGVVLVKSIGCFIIYFMSDLDTDAFELPIPGTWFPFNWKNPVGYIIACSIEYIFLLNRLFAAFFALVFEVGSIFMLICMADDIKLDLNSINEEVTYKESRLEIVKRFKEIIQFNFDAKQLTEAFSKPWKPIFLAVFSWSTIAICASLLLIQMQIDSNYPVDAILYRFFQLCISLATVFSFCEFCHRVSNAFEESSTAFDQLKWHLFPVEMWRIIPTVIAATQRPIHFYVFGSISCSREDFKMVANKSYTYFMMLKHFGMR